MRYEDYGLRAFSRRNERMRKDQWRRENRRLKRQLEHYVRAWGREALQNLVDGIEADIPAIWPEIPVKRRTISGKSRRMAKLIEGAVSCEN